MISINRLSGGFLLIICMYIFFMCLEHVQAEKEIVFYDFMNSFSVNTNQIQTVFLAPGFKDIFRAYLELHYHDDFNITGSQRFLNSEAFISNPPQVVIDNNLKVETILVWEVDGLQVPKSNNKQTITLKFYPQFTMSLDPYSIRAYIIEPLAPREFKFTPFFPISDNLNSTLGPWEGTLDLKDYLLRKSIQIVFFGNSNVKEQLDVSVPIAYPREVIYDMKTYLMHITYPNASVVIPSERSVLPTVTVSNNNGKVVLPDSSLVVLTQHMITEDNKDIYTLDEVRYFEFQKDLQVNRKFIDLYSLKCAYAFSDTNFQQLVIDPTSDPRLIQRDVYRTALVCNQLLTQSSYVMAVVGLPVVVEDCQNDATCRITKNIKSIVYGSVVDLIFDPKTQLTGTFYPKNRFGEFNGIKPTPTSQGILSQYATFSFDFSDTKILRTVAKTSDLQNVITIRWSRYLTSNEEGKDPYSFRIFKLNDEGNLFELVSDDVPRLGVSSFSFDCEELLKSGRSKTIVLSLFVYDGTDAALGDVVYANYPRKVYYSLDKYVSLGIYYKKVGEAPYFPLEKRPFFTLNSYKPKNVKGLDNYVVLYSFMQQNGNDLESVGFDDGREFSISPNAELVDSATGKPITFAFSELRCVYLFQETNFESIEISRGFAYFHAITKRYNIDCYEDIRDENFVFMLVAKPIIRDVVKKSTDSPSAISPLTIDEYSSFWLPMDALTVSVNSNSRSTGNYTLKADKRHYLDYALPKTKQEPLSMVGVYILDTNNVKLFSSNDVDTKITITYQKNTTDRNFDPFSYRFFSFDDEKQEFNWLNCEDVQSSEEWSLSIDMSLVRRIKFAVFAYNNKIGVKGQSYSIHYERSLKYSLEGGQDIEFSFSSAFFPVLNNGVTFTMTENDNAKAITGFVNVKSLSISQTVKSDIFTNRVFTFSSKLTDLEGKKIANLNSLQCVYVLPNGARIYGGNEVSNSSSIYTLTCAEIILHANYDLIIVAQDPPTPPPPTPPVPQPSIRPEPSKPVPQPSIIPEPSIRPPTPPVPQPSIRPEPSIKPEPSRPVPEPSIIPEPSIRPPTPPTPQPSIKPEPSIRPEPSIKPEPSRPVPQPTIRPEPTKPRPKPSITPGPQPIPQKSSIAPITSTPSTVFQLESAITVLSVIVAVLFVSVIGLSIVIITQCIKHKKRSTEQEQFLGVELHNYKSINY